MTHKKNGTLGRLTCRIYGFYPTGTKAVWKKDGVVWMQNALPGGILPNSDRTYHSWLSIEIDPNERGRYLCHIKSDDLSGPNIWLAPGDFGNERSGNR